MQISTTSCKLIAVVSLAVLPQLQGAYSAGLPYSDPSTCLFDYAANITLPAGRKLIPVSDRLDINISGIKMPLQAFAMWWDSSLILGNIFKILVEEVLGVNVVVDGGGSQIPGIYALAGCQNFWAWKKGPIQAQCVGVNYSTWFSSFEVWDNSLAIEDLWQVLGDKRPYPVYQYTYDSYEQVLQFPKSFNPASADGLHLEYYTSFNTTWHNPQKYFDKLTDLDQSKFSLCTEVANNNARVGNAFKVATNDLDGFDNQTQKIKCHYLGKWFLAAGVCRSNESLCIPYYTAGDGPNFGEIAQKVTYYNLPIAVGCVSAWGPWYGSASKRVLVYNWFPDSTFNHLLDHVIQFPPKDQTEWNNGKTTTASSAIPVRAWVSYYASTITRWNSTETLFDAIKIAKKMDLTTTALQKMFPKLKWNADWSAALNHDALACEWIRDNFNVVASWIPLLTECQKGFGFVDDQNQYVSSRSQAAGCAYCVAGTFSEFYLDAQGSSYLCSVCPPGNITAMGGQTECLSCDPGTYASKSGSTKCQSCALGTYQDKPGQSKCLSCPNLMTTLNLQSRDKKDCACSASSFRPCFDPANGSKLRKECTCDPSMYAPPGDQNCFECGEGLACNFGSDESNLPCSPTDYGRSNYPTADAGYMTRWGEPLSVYMCKDNYTCPGNGTQACGPHHRGIACAECEKGYYLDSDGHCSECGPVLSFPIIPVILILLLPAFLFVMYQFGKAPIDSWSSWTNTLAGIVYVSLAFMQTMGTLLQMLPDMPSQISDSLSWSTQVTDITRQFRLSCSTTGNFKLVFLSKLLTPWFAAAFVIAIYAGLYFTRFRADKDILFSIYGSVFNAFFITVMAQCFSLFQMYQHPNGDWSLNEAPQILRSSFSWLELIGASVITIAINCIGAMVMYVWVIRAAPARFHDEAFRRRWKFMLVQMRPSAYWWAAILQVKAVWLALTAVIFSTSMSQIVWLGLGLLLYFIGSFSLLPWRSVITFILDVFMHYLLSILCLIMPFLVSPTAAERTKVAQIFVAFFFLTVTLCALSFLLLLYIKSPQSQRTFLLTYDRNSREYALAFSSLQDPKALAEVMKQLPYLDVVTLASAARILNAEMFGVIEQGRLQWRKHGFMDLPNTADGKFQPAHACEYI